MLLNEMMLFKDQLYFYYGWFPGLVLMELNSNEDEGDFAEWGWNNRNVVCFSFNIFPTELLFSFFRGTLVYQMCPSPWRGVKILSVWVSKETTTS